MSSGPGAPFFEQGALSVALDGDTVVVRHGDDVTVRLAPDATPQWTRHRDHIEAVVAVVDVVVEALLQRRSHRFHVHAGVVVDDAVATLVLGPSGAGKTTTTLALARAGGALGGDDVGFVSRRDDGVVVVTTLRRPLHLGEATARLFGEIVPDVDDGVRTLQGKRVVPHDLADVVAVPVARLVFPRIAAVSTTTSRSLPPAEALAKLMVASASVAWPLPGTEAHLDVLGRLAALPAVEVTLGRDALDDAGAIVRAVDVVATSSSREPLSLQGEGRRGSAG
jgi:hypothetical protein